MKLLQRSALPYGFQSADWLRLYTVQAEFTATITSLSDQPPRTDKELPHVTLLGPRSGPPRFLKHRHRPVNCLTVGLQLATGGPKLITLKIVSSHQDWRKDWVSWRLKKRTPQSTKGGESWSGQDRLTEEGMILGLYPDEERLATCDFAIHLKGPITEGEYPFYVLALDSESKTPLGAVCEFSLKVVHPPSRMLDQLPAIYSQSIAEASDEEEAKTSFFPRYLLGFEDTIQPIIETANHLEELFGAYSTPQDFLRWLGGWVCCPTVGQWPEMQRRRVISEAVSLYRWRGTKRSLARLIELYTGVVPTITDQPMEGLVLDGRQKMGDPSARLGHNKPFNMVISMRRPSLPGFREEDLHAIILSEKPAFAAYELRLLDLNDPK